MKCLLLTKLSSESVTPQSPKQKHEVTRHSLLILYIFDMFFYDTMHFYLYTQ